MSDHFQGDEILGKAFDAQLMRRLIRFLKPYRVLFVVCVLLTIGLAGIQLVIPYFTKTAIDSFMTLPHSIVQLPEAPEEGFPIDLGNGEYLVETLNVSPESRRKWEEADLLSVERYIFIPNGSEQAEYPDRFPDVFTEIPGGWIASDKDLGLLPINDLEALRGTSIAGIIRLAMMFLMALLAQFIFGVLQVYLLQYTGQRVMYDMRQEIFAHVLRLPLKFFDHAPVGRLVTRVTSDVQAINEMFTSMLVNLFRDAFLILGIMIVIFQLDWRLALAIFAFFPVIVFAAWQFRNRVRTAYREVRKQIARMNAYLQESISGMRIIQVFVQEHKANERFDDINQAKYVADMRQLMTFAVFRPLMSFLSSFAIALVIWYGGFNVLRGSLSLGALTAFIQYVRMLFEPVLRLSEGYNVLQGAMASSERIFRLLDEPQEDAGRGTTIESFQAKIEFKDVWFAYNEEEWILKGVSLTAEPGQHVAIVGPTGSGKTTIIRILLRMYPIQKGQILLDGIPIEEFDLSYLRAQMAVVLQDVFMFSGDIMDNIKLRSPIPEDRDLL